ncbi:hypothetical protein B5F10_14015 [Anaerotruncus colihominis]|nr:hypothetical protein B5F10_14015 [Anaerotruncus colihominis]
MIKLAIRAAACRARVSPRPYEDKINAAHLFYHDRRHSSIYLTLAGDLFAYRLCAALSGCPCR